MIKMVLSVLSTVLGFVGALAILLWGMDLLSSGVQKGAGDKLQKLFNIVSGNRFTAVLTGLLITSIIQSSGATTVMVVSFVNAQILTLKQAIGIIFGANIGTTVTAWIISLFGFSFKISAFAVPLIGIGFFIKSLKKTNINELGDIILGFGMLFLGLDFLSSTLTLNADQVWFIHKITEFGFWGIILGVIIGMFVTMLLHSSSAFTAIVLTMASQGLLDWQFSAALILGSNIGTTADSLLAAGKANTNGKRVAAVHVGFNFVGTLIALCFFKPFLALVDLIVPGAPADDITNHLAMLHTVFNTVTTLIFLPFVDQIASLVTKLIKEPKSEKVTEKHYKFPIIVSKNRKAVEIYIMQIEKEVAIMSAKVMDMLQQIFTTLNGSGTKTIDGLSEDIVAEEKFIDEMNEAISSFLMQCYRMEGSNSAAQRKIDSLLQITSGVEGLSDECASIVHSLKKYVHDTPDHKPSSYERLTPYLQQVEDFFTYICQRLSVPFELEDREITLKMEENIDNTKKELKKLACHRIEDGKNVKTELHFIDIVRHIERAGDCIYGIANVL